MYDDLNGNKCVNCPVFTYSDVSKDKCSLMDVLQNNKYSSRFIAKNLKKEIEDTCKNEDGICDKSFIGPIQNKDSLFFISFDKQNQINLDDFTVKESNLDKGHIFELYNSQTHFSKNGKSEIIENVKELRNLGSQIANVTLINKNVFKKPNKLSSGILIKYDNGDECEDNISIF